MTTSTARSAQGTTIEVGNGDSPLTYEFIRNCSNIQGLRGGSRTEIDVTDLTSDAKEYRLGLTDNGSITAAVNYNPDEDGHIRLEELLDEDDPESFRITDIDGQVWTFLGLVKKFDISWAVDNVQKSNLEIRVTGAVTKA